MKLSPKHSHSRLRAAGLTLIEMYITTAIVVMLVLAVTACQIFAIKIYNLAATKLTATAEARKAMNDIRDQIRSSSNVQVGIYSPQNNTFSLIGIGTNQTGNALAIFTSNNTNFGTVYFMDNVNSNLSSINITNGAIETATLTSNIVVYITNYYVFTAEGDFSNNSTPTILTTYDNDRIIHVLFQFAQWEYPMAGVGNGNMYDYYQLQTRVGRRISDY